MSNFTDFFPAAGGGGLTPKFQEFNSSATFTPTQALIDAGGYIEVFLVAAGGRSQGSSNGASGGETFLERMYLTSTSGCAVVIAAAVTVNGSTGGNSSFAGASAGGSDLTAVGGEWNNIQRTKLGTGWGALSNLGLAAGNGFMGYGAGGGGNGDGGITEGKANSGQGSSINSNSGSGYCLIKWFE